MNRNFTICRADELLAAIDTQTAATPFDYVISLEHPGAETLSYAEGKAPRLAALDPQWTDRQLILSCYDLEQDVGDLPAPGREIVEAALAHDRRWTCADRPTKALIHCRSGKARSTALALVLLRQHLGPGSEQAALDEVLRIRPIAAPNLAIVRHGDDILGCEGRLVVAVEQNEAVTVRRNDAEQRRHLQIESRRVGRLTL